MRLRALAVILAVVLAGCGGNDEPPDSDGDGLTDAQEHNGWVVTVDLLDRRARYNVTSDPLLQDTDGDGVLDVHEALLGLDPRKKDTDEDGLTDCEEAQHSVRPECEDPDWEGTTDGGLPTSANNADSDPGRGRYKSDVVGFDDPTDTVLLPVSWGDGISDGDELAGFTIPLDGGGSRIVMPDPMRIDTDSDLLEDAEELFLYQTDPTTPDTDADGCDDGRDPIPRHAEMYAPAVANVTYTGQHARVEAVITIIVADHIQPVPAESRLTLDRGRATTPPAPEPFRPGSCTSSPMDPWVRLDLYATRYEDGAAVSGLDLTSMTAPDGVGLWWNVAEATFRWGGRDGPVAPVGEGLTLEGDDGSMELTAHVLT